MSKKKKQLGQPGPSAEYDAPTFGGPDHPSENADSAQSAAGSASSSDAAMPALEGRRPVDKASLAKAAIVPAGTHAEHEQLKQVRTHVSFKWLFGTLFLLALAVAAVMILHKVQVAKNASELWNEANAAADKGDTAKAIRLVDQYLRLNPQDVTALEKLGQWVDESANDVRAWARVLLVYEEVLRREPTHEKARRTMINYSIRLGRFKEALDHLSLIGDKDSWDRQLWYWAGQSHQSQREFEPAYEAFISATGADPKIPDSYLAVVGLLEDKPNNAPNRADLAGGYAAKSPLVDIFLPQDQQPEDLKAKAPEMIEKILAAMVDQTDPRARGLLARADYYTAKHRFAEAQADINQALKEAGNDAALKEEIQLKTGELLLAQGDEASATSDAVTASQFYSQARKIAEDRAMESVKNPKFLWLLARIYTRMGNSDAAEEQLLKTIDAVAAARQAVKSVSVSTEDLLMLEVQSRWTMCDLRITKALDKNGLLPTAAIPGLQEELSSVQIAGASGPLLSFLLGRIKLGQEAWSEAAPLLALAQTVISESTETGQRLALLLGDCHRRLNNPDAELAVYRSAVQEMPLWGTGRVAVAEVLSQQNRIAEALEQYSLVMRSPPIPVRVARILMREQLAAPPEARNWSEVERALDIANEVMPDDVQTSITRAEFQVSHDQFAQAEQTLNTYLNDSPAEGEAWAALVRLALMRKDHSAQGQLETAQAVLERAKAAAGDQLVLRLAEAAILLRSQAGSAKPLIMAMTAGLDAFPREMQVDFLVNLAALAHQANERALAKELRLQMCDAYPNYLPVRLEIADSLLEDADLAVAQRIISDLRRIEGKQSPNADFVEARWLISQLKMDVDQIPSKTEILKALAKPKELLNNARRTRPSWSVVCSMLGDVEWVLGNRKAAVAIYQEAFKLGDRDRELITRVLDQYYVERDFASADKLLQILSVEAPHLLSGNTARLAWKLAWEENDYERALGLSSTVVAEGGNVQDKILHAQLLVARVQMLTPAQQYSKESSERLAEAEKLFKEAVAQAPENASTWFAYVTYLFRRGLSTTALAQIETAQSQLKDEPPGLRALSLARMYELAGPDYLQKAKESYIESLTNSDNATAFRVAVADFFVRHGLEVEANEQLEKLTSADSGSPDEIQNWARRRQALVIAGRGSYKDTIEALRLLRGTIGNVEESPDDLRMQAAILAQVNNFDNRQRLVSVYQDLGQKAPLTFQEEVDLAALLESVGKWPEAKELLQKLRDREPTNADISGMMGIGLLRNEPIDDDLLETVKDMYDTLVALEPTSFRTAEVGARLAVVHEKPADAEQLLQGFVDALSKPAFESQWLVDVENTQPAQLLDRIAEQTEFIGGISTSAVKEMVGPLVENNRSEEASALLRERLIMARAMAEQRLIQITLAASTAEELKLTPLADRLFRELAASSYRREESFELARFLGRIGKTGEAIQICEQMMQVAEPTFAAAQMVAVFEGQPIESSDLAKVERLVKAAIEKSPQSRRALVALAALRTLQRNLAEAKAIYQALLEQRSDAAVLNNLAWIMAIEGQDLDTALSYIKQAIEERGPLPELLDTRALVQIARQDYPAAVKDLVAATSDSKQPVMYYHLALAYAKNKQTTEARRMLERSITYGFTEKGLLPQERPWWDELQRLLQTGG